jgi:uncharacterized protein YkwD
MRTATRALPLAAVAVVFALTACAPTKAPAPVPPPPAPGPPSLPFDNADPIAKELVSSTNSDRAANALDPLAWNDQLGGLAQSWSDHMATTGQLVHQDLDALRQTPAYSGFSALNENILEGVCTLTASQIEAAFLSSPPHKVNILGNFTAVGIGVKCNDTILFVTVVFGR